MKPAPFEYVRPGTLEEALRLLAEQSGEAKLIAGGQSLVPMMNFRLARPELLIDINSLAALDYHRRDGDVLAIGALARHATLSASALVRSLCPLVTEAYRHVAHGTVRNRGTLCGNLCHADPASEMPAVMLVLGATLVLRSARGERRVAASDFFTGLYSTVVKPDEMLIEVRIPVTAVSCGHGFAEVSARKGDYAMTLVASTLDIRGGRIYAAALAYAGVSDRALRMVALESRLVSQVPSQALFNEVAEAAAHSIDVGEDQHADRAYRSDLIRTLTPRALAQAAASIAT